MVTNRIHWAVGLVLVAMMRGLAIVVSGVDNPRADNARHDLSQILFIALAAVICGAQGCADLGLFGRSKEPILR